MIRKTGNIAKNIQDTYVKQSNIDNKNEKQGELMIDLHPENELNKNEGENINNNLKEISIQQELEALKKENEELIAELNKVQKERDEFKDQLLRKAAEFENFKNRTQKEKEELIYFANVPLIKNILDIVDNLEKANESVKKSNDYEALVKGLEMIEQQIKSVLKEEGLSEIETNIHDALMAVDSDLEPGKIAQIFKKGYKIKDKVIRHAKVATSKEK